MFCSNCRAQLPDGSRFCGECGAEIGNAFPSTPPVTAQPETWAKSMAQSKWGQNSYNSMPMLNKIYFISAWVVAVAAVLTVILMPIGRADSNTPGLMIFANICQVVFLGLTGVFTLLSLSGWFKNGLALFVLAWVVAGLALLTFILLPVSYGDYYRVPGTVIAGDIFLVIFLGVFCTIVLLHQSQWFTKDEKILSGSPEHDGEYLSDSPVNTRCPKCGSETVIKTATSGENVGRRFLVCTRYPACKGKVPLTDIDEFST